MQKSKRCLTSPQIAAFSALAFGLIVHLFGLINLLHNHDDICVQPFGYGAGVESGRWFLTILGNTVETLLGGYNLSWLSGLLFLCFLSASVYLLTVLFEIQKPAHAVLLGVIFVTFPSVCATLAFRFTTVYYGIAIFLSVLCAFWLLRAKKQYILWGLIATLLAALMLGIYQAYISVTVTVLVLSLLMDALKAEKPWQKILYRGIYCCVVLVLGLVLYLVGQKICQHLYNETLSGYRNMDTLGESGLSRLPAQLIQAFAVFVNMPLHNNFDLAPLPIIQWIYWILGGVSAVALVYILIKRKVKWMQALLSLFLCGVFPVAVNLILFMVDASEAYTLMAFAFVFVLFVPILLCEALPPVETEKKPAAAFQKITSRAIAVLLSVQVFSYAYLTNVNYTAMYYANRQTENYYTAMVTQIRMTEGFRADQNWVFIGSEPHDPLLWSHWNNAPLFGGVSNTPRMVESYSWPHWIRNYTGYTVPLADSETKERLLQSEIVQTMPCYPNQGSIQVVEDVVVIKFSDPRTNAPVHS